MIDVFFDHTTQNRCISAPDHGKKFIVLEIGSTGCSRCLGKLPTVQSLFQQIESVATVRLVYESATESDVWEFYDYYKSTDYGPYIDFPIAADASGYGNSKYGLLTYPRSEFGGYIYYPYLVVLDENGNIIKTYRYTWGDSDIESIKHDVGL